SITFGHPGEVAGIRNSSVGVNVALGQGNTNLAFNYGVDLGDFTDVAGPAGFGASTMNVNINGRNRGREVDNIKFNAKGAGEPGPTLNLNTNLGAGNSSFKGVFDASTFRIANGAGGLVGGAAHFNVAGGRGDNAISLKSTNQNQAIELSGL